MDCLIFIVCVCSVLGGETGIERAERRVAKPHQILA